MGNPLSWRCSPLSPLIKGGPQGGVHTCEILSCSYSHIFTEYISMRLPKSSRLRTPDFESMLFEKDHFPRLNKIACFQATGIHAAAQGPTELVPTVPGHSIQTNPLGFIDKHSYLLSHEIVDDDGGSDGYFDFRYLISDVRMRIEWVGCILEEIINIWH